MRILKRYADEEDWHETTEEECLEHTEGAGYWLPETVIDMLKEGHEVFTPFARYKVVTENAKPGRGRTSTDKQNRTGVNK